MISDFEIEGFYKRYKANKRKLTYLLELKANKPTFSPPFHSGESKTESVASSKADLEKEISIVEMCYCMDVMGPNGIDWIEHRYFNNREWEDIAGLMHESVSSLKRIRLEVISKTRQMIILKS